MSNISHSCKQITTTVAPKHESRLYIPYLIIAGIVASGGLALLALYIYKKYVPPRLPHAPPAFAEEMPQELTNFEKFQIWKENIPNSYTMILISVGSVLLLAYYGLEMTYLQFLAQFITSTPLPIFGMQSALVETATGATYAFGGLISIYLSKQIDMIKKKLINNPAILLGYRQKSFSILTM
ncbi:unnamed protein product [Oppiella nova]|uniref:Uncharacterized protein n=1 Tax=Oppiella nova TaxID=334625 RepID=A0A7R9ML80_9ACAR|nr:unnamed protein product [Oppiella nova]CAG2179435.1 unnamed protein product [Oppiella nova]